MFKNIFVTILLVIGIALGFIFVGDNHEEITEDEELSALNSRIETSVENYASSSQLDSGSDKPYRQHTDSDSLSNEIKSWRISRGYLLEYENDQPIETDYTSYSLETLRALAKQNDTRAIMLLAETLARDKDAQEERRSLYIDASVHGYTNSMISLAQMSFSHFYSHEDEKIGSRQHAIEAYAWLELALLRGDLQSNQLINMYDISFNENELDKIGKLADQYMREMQSKREALGLPPFNNDIHDDLIGRY